MKERVRENVASRAALLTCLATMALFTGLMFSMQPSAAYATEDVLASAIEEGASSA